MASRARDVRLKIRGKTQFSIEISIAAKAWPKIFSTKSIGLFGSVAALQAFPGKPGSVPTAFNPPPDRGHGPMPTILEKVFPVQPGPRPATREGLTAMGADVPYPDGRSDGDFSASTRYQARYRSFSTAFIEDNIQSIRVPGSRARLWMACRFRVNSRGFAGRAMAGRRP